MTQISSLEVWHNKVKQLSNIFLLGLLPLYWSCIYFGCFKRRPDFLSERVRFTFIFRNEFCSGTSTWEIIIFLLFWLNCAVVSSNFGVMWLYWRLKTLVFLTHLTSYSWLFPEFEVENYCQYGSPIAALGYYRKSPFTLSLDWALY